MAKRTSILKLGLLQDNGNEIKSKLKAKSNLIEKKHTIFCYI